MVSVCVRCALASTECSSENKLSSVDVYFFWLLKNISNN